ncbi:MAG: diacylglycerol kinase [Burkholderiaceae bacterium]
MPPKATSPPEPATAQKSRGGISRLWHATRYSLNGLHAACSETAFRQEVIAAVVMVPAAFWLGQSWVERALLAASVVLVLVVELLNTAVEKTIDRIGPEWHDLARRAKDMGSAAVLLSLLMCGAIWLGAAWSRFAY